MQKIEDKISKLPILNKSFLTTDIWKGATLTETILTLLLAVITYTMVTYESEHWMYYCTNWGHMLTFAYYFLSVAKSYYHITDDKASISRWLSLCLHISCSFQFMIFFFYWPMLSKNEIFSVLQYEKQSEGKYYFYMGIWRHLANPLLTWIPILTCRTRFQAKNFYIQLVVSAVYMYVNYLGCIAFGKPVYSVIDWKSTKSHIFMLIGISLSFIGFYIGLSTSKAVHKRLKYVENS